LFKPPRPHKIRHAAAASRFSTATGTSPFTAQRIYASASLLRVQAEATRLSDTAALFMALGGGWWNRE
jgi:outer membrane protein TolC